MNVLNEYDQHLSDIHPALSIANTSTALIHEHDYDEYFVFFIQLIHSAIK